MITKEKAKELVTRVKQLHIIAIKNSNNKLVYPHKSKVIANEVIECQYKEFALLVCDEIIKNFTREFEDEDHIIELDKVNYWKDVKKEIKKI